MKKSNLNSIFKGLDELGLSNAKGVFWNLSPAELITEAIKNGEGVLTDTGALMWDTGKFTGRSPNDRYIVKDDYTRNKVWWGDINISYDEERFDTLYQKVIQDLNYKKLYIRDAYAGADERYRMKIRVIDTQATHNLFCYNMFLRPKPEELVDFHPDFRLLIVPEYMANPEEDGTRSKNFAIIHFQKRLILVGGTGYTGETKKGVFSVLNFLLPEQEHVLSMHCSANMGPNGDTAVFFGLSGTGKTTLSADKGRQLIGDDEHGWTDEGVFNFEGGCYAKVIDLSPENEPEIYQAIRYGAILENTRFFPGTTKVDYSNTELTQNTRVSYPIYHIPNAVEPSVGGIPKNIFFLTCDAYGVLPPISRLNIKQAMYQFISGYTAKVAGTETGVVEPEAVFSACFGAPFMPLHPSKYAELLGEKIDKHKVNIWLINTGWTGGPYGIGHRISLKYTRQMIRAALNGELNDVSFKHDKFFGLEVPESCPGIPDQLLFPEETWSDKSAYAEMALKLIGMFHANFEQFEEGASDEILQGAPGWKRVMS